jgi:nicotinate phosphoribosyltransferase
LSVRFISFKIIKINENTITDIEFFKKILPNNVEEEFFNYLSQVSANEVTLYAIPEGSVVFPKVPMIRMEGPLPIVQLLETTLLTLVNYARFTSILIIINAFLMFIINFDSYIYSLITTNATRYRIALDERDIKLLEFGLRRAQGPDGGLSGITVF